MAVVVTLCAAILVLAGCGSSSSSSSSSASTHAAIQPIHAQKARQTSNRGNADIGSARVQTAAASVRRQRVRARTVVGPAGKVQKARQTPGSTNDDVTATGAPSLNPCNLVSLSEARTITRGSIRARIEAPLGPTCIYREAKAKNNITLAVETLSASQVARQMHKPAKLDVGGHAAYCGRLGMQMLFVQLPGGRSLNVTAPCPVAKRFAAVALKRLTV
jgi:hypothetical protein